MPGQTFAYLRVSKLDQDLEKNKADILKLANEAHLGHVQFIEEKVFGKVSWRKRQIAAILDGAGPGWRHDHRQRVISPGQEHAGVHGNSFSGHAERHSHLRRQRELAAQHQYPE